jgi:drug/metabolite transporter (DMT)-like permease
MHRLRLGIALMLASCISFTLMSYAVKELSAVLTSADTLLIRSLLTSCIILFSISVYSPIQHKSGNQKLLLISRGVAGAIGVLLIFYCIKISNLVITATFLQTTPMFIACLSYIWLGQRLSAYKCIAIVIGFIGTVCITQQVSFSFEVLLVGLAIGMLAAYAYTSVYKLRNYYETRVIILSFSIAGLILGVVLSADNYLANQANSLFSWQLLSSLDAWHWVLICTVGIAATLSQTFLTHAYTVAPAYIMSTIGYATIPMTFLCDVFIYQQSFSWVNILGILLVVISSIAVARKH